MNSVQPDSVQQYMRAHERDLNEYLRPWAGQYIRANLPELFVGLPLKPFYRVVVPIPEWDVALVFLYVNRPWQVESPTVSVCICSYDPTMIGTDRFGLPAITDWRYVEPIEAAVKELFKDGKMHTTKDTEIYVEYV